MDKITLPAVSYKNNKVIESEGEFVEFHQTYIKNYGSSKAEVLLDSGFTEIREYDFNFVIFKESINSIQRIYDHSDECWKVILTGGTYIEFIMKSKIASQALLDKILSWKTS